MAASSAYISKKPMFETDCYKLEKLVRIPTLGAIAEDIFDLKVPWQVRPDDCPSTTNWGPQRVAFQGATLQESIQNL
jgi:hypothetical protein